MKHLLLFNLFVFQLLAVSCGPIDNELCLDKPEFRVLTFSGVDVYTDIDDALACAAEVKKPLFLLFTGYGARGCRKPSFEERLFENWRFRKLVAEEFIPVIMYVDDDTRLNPIQTVRFGDSQRLLRNLGNKYSNYQVTKFKQNSQPMLAILDHNGEHVFRMSTYKSNANSYYYFLKDGLEGYQAWASQ